MERSPEETRSAYISELGPEFGDRFYRLVAHFVQLQERWGDYVELYGKKPSRVEILNQAAPALFNRIQEVLWRDVLLSIARLTDKPNSGPGRENLTLFALAESIECQDTKALYVKQLLTVINSTTFCRDWRNRVIAHSDLKIATGAAVVPLESANRLKVKQSLHEISRCLNIIFANYLDTQMAFDLTYDGVGGAECLLLVMDDGIRANKARMERLQSGNFTDDDFSQREI